MNTTWILLVIAVMYNGTTSQSLEFPTAEGCGAALQRIQSMAENAPRDNRGIRVYLSCVEKK